MGWAWIAVAGCAPQTSANSTTPVFGGVGAVVEVPATAQGAGSASGAGPGSGPCAAPRPASEKAIIDDFEDGDGRGFKVLQRDAWWWAASDGTAEALLEPAPGQFKPALRDDPPAPAGGPGEIPRADANVYAAHFEAAGQTDWGASWGMTLRWIGEGLKCPFNASNFVGVRFVARGSGPVWLQLGMPTTTPVSEELGECKQACWDTYTAPVALKPDWQRFLIPFESLQQRGFGTEVPFDPARLLSVAFQAMPQHLPIDFWVDDIAFVTADELAQWKAASATP